MINKVAVQATLHCLTGCAIGEVLGMVIGTGLGWHNAGTVAISVVLAFFFGYLLTFIPVYKSGMDIKRAVKTTLAADTISIITMEIIDNALMLLLPGAMDATLVSWLFWGSLVISLFIAFWVTVPINGWLISRGKGHAVVHAMHGHASEQNHHHTH